MGDLVAERVELARHGRNPFVICRMPSGWLVMGDNQPLPGYCILLSDPVVESLNALDEVGRTNYSLDAIRAGDALLEVTGAHRINYETWGNAEPSLHTHIMPRYRSEPEDKRRLPVCMAYDWSRARRFNSEVDGPFIQKMRGILVSSST